MLEGDDDVLVGAELEVVGDYSGFVLLDLIIVGATLL